MFLSLSGIYFRFVFYSDYSRPSPSLGRRCLVAHVPRSIDHIEQLKRTKYREAWRVFVCLYSYLRFLLIMNLLVINLRVKNPQALAGSLPLTALVLVTKVGIFKVL